MSYLTLPKRALDGPLMEFANFEDGSFVNLIKIRKPYSDGYKYSVHETTRSPFCSNGIFKTYEKAKEKFELMIKNAQHEVYLKERGCVKR